MIFEFSLDKAKYYELASFYGSSFLNAYELRQSENLELERDYNFPKVERDEANYLSDNGKPIRFPIIIKGGKYKTVVDGEVKEIEIDDIKLPDSTIVKFSRKKILNRTPIEGANKTFKEYGGFDDWQMSFKGVCIGKGAKYPKEEVEKLLLIESITDSLTINVGELFTMKGILAIATSDFDFPPVGYVNLQPFSFKAYSDVPKEIMIK